MSNNSNYLSWEITEIKLGILLLLTIMLFLKIFSFNIDFLILIYSIDLIFFLIILIFLLKRQNISLKLVGLVKFKKEMLVHGVALFLLAYFLIFLINIFFHLININIPSYNYGIIFNLSPKIWLLFIKFSISGPFVEELFDRGFIFSGLRSHFGWKKAAILSSALFAFAHISSNDLYALLPTFILGMALAYLYQKSNSILPGMIIHSLNNFFILAIKYKLYMQNLN